MLRRMRKGVPGMVPVLAGLVLAALACVPPARAAGDGKPEGALALIPANASFYSAMLRNKEQIDLIARSKAWAALRDMPGVKMAWQMVQAQYTEQDGKLAPLRAFLEQEENQELVAFLGDAVSHEIFFCGGANWVPFFELTSILNNAQRYGPLPVLIEKGPQAVEKNNLQAQLMLRALAAHPELIQVPDFIVGFKLTDTKRAQNQLKRLEVIAVALSGMNPALKGRVKTVKVGDDSFLTVNLDGSMVPWDEIPIKSVEEKEGEFDGLVKKLKETKLTISLGVKGDYLLLGIGSSADVVAQVGGRGKHLADLPELKPVLAAADKRLTSIGYASAALRAESGSSARDVDNLLAFGREALAAADIPEASKKKIGKDLETMSREMLKEAPTYGAEVSFAYLTGRGIESWSYDYTKELSLDGSRPLTLLNHLGGNPIFAAVARQKSSPEGYQGFVKWIKVFYGHAAEVLLAKLEKEQREVYEKYSKEIFPFLKRLDEINGKMLLPALADGQLGFVLDAKWKSKQWHQALPELPVPLPLPEVAVVLGVSDADLLRKAMSSYRTLFNDAIAKARELVPQADIPDIQVPEPESKETRVGNLFYYPLPPLVGVDPQVVPTAGLSKKVAVLTLSHAAAERILQSKPLEVKGDPLADLKKPRASASYFNCPALVDTLAPWAEMGVTMIVAQQLRTPDEESAKKAQMEMLAQLRTVLRVLKVFRGSSSSTAQEDGVWVTHGETVIRDLEE
jgi:hypothetical protein